MQQDKDITRSRRNRKQEKKRHKKVEEKALRVHTARPRQKKINPSIYLHRDDDYESESI